MASAPGRNHSRQQLLLWGAASLTLYALLLRFEQSILAWSTQGRWFFMLPILIAFAFSLVHGRFTGAFWENLGIRAKD
ncbi:MAG: hypothetical protein HQL91_13540 [Magnetococcales bacterium]|nr:hypothetical protein [Magnetococcales bacterium]